MRDAAVGFDGVAHADDPTRTLLPLPHLRFCRCNYPFRLPLSSLPPSLSYCTLLIPLILSPSVLLLSPSVISYPCYREDLHGTRERRFPSHACLFFWPKAQHFGKSGVAEHVEAKGFHGFLWTGEQW